MLTFDQLISPAEPPAEVGAGPVLARTHAGAVAAVRYLETMVALSRHHLETAPRMDAAFDAAACEVWHAMTAADRAVQRFRASRDCAGEG